MMKDPDKDRGTGRTTRQLLAAPQKFYFIVGGMGMLNHARTLIRRHCPEKDVEIVLLSNMKERLRGTDLPIVPDHDAVDKMTNEQMQWLYPMMSRNNPS